MIQTEQWEPDKDGLLTEAAMRDSLENCSFCFRYVNPPETYFPDHMHDVYKSDGVLFGGFSATVFR